MTEAHSAKLAGKVACVTGSGQGIGQAIAIRLAKEGADVVVDDRVIGESAQQTVAAIQKLGRRAVTVQGDLGNPADDRRVIAEAVAQMGKIDILVNNAGVERRADFWDVTEQDFDFVLNINLRGTFFITQDFVNHLRATNRPGRIINISSVHEELPFPHFSTYCASKGALKMLCRDLAIELAPLGITVNNIAPGAIETPINKDLLNNPEELKMLLGKIPLGRLGTPDDVARLAAFLASDDAAYITGSTVTVDGGLLWNYQEQ
ncbi:MAG: glucose 1-dehydrogenase [Chthoniobacter sp.]|uniref:SDR family NAD(P)-dependent oxidoreductase n=1 Tax=Chthoniobacter sp. TaxID=2510640 RepID=UPI0032A50E8E